MVEAGRRSAYEAALNDADAAAALRIHLKAFAAWRQSRGLPARTRLLRRRLHESEEQNRLAAYGSTESDAAAAKRLGMLDGSFRAWRMRRGLPPKTPPVRLTAEDERRRRQIYRGAPSDGEAANNVGLTRSGFEAWRRRHGLASLRNRPSGHIRRPGRLAPA